MDKKTRIVTNDDIIKYDKLVEKFIRDSVCKNWNEADNRKHMGDVVLGNTGYCLNDLRQYLRMQVVIALQNYDPEYTNADGQKASEFTFVYGHLWRRIGQKMNQMTGKHYGYGVWTSRIENVLRELDEE